MSVFALFFVLASAAQINGQCSPQYSPMLIPEPDKDTGLFEGDIRFTAEQLSQMHASAYNVLPSTSFRRWGTKGATVPYTLSASYTAHQKSTINSALSALSTLTNGCIRFKQRTTERAYISVIRGGGCWSNIGRIGSKQELSLGYGCLSRGTIQHEFLHALGFWHEQSRADRDNYVRIMWNNINSRFCNNFRKVAWGPTHHHGQEYDYTSVMHYGSTAFSRNRLQTIVPVWPDARIGQRYGASAIDIKKLKSLYNC